MSKPPASHSRAKAAVRDKGPAPQIPPPGPGDDRPRPPHWHRLFGPELMLPALISFFLGLPIYARLVGATDYRSVFSDYPAHLSLALQLADHGEFPPHPLFHICLILLSCGFNPLSIVGMAAVQLALASGARAYLSAYLFAQRSNPSLLVIIAVCLALALAMPLPNWWSFVTDVVPNVTDYFDAKMPSAGWWKLPMIHWGQVSPNVWHNPTTIFAIPFCLLLFLVASNSIEAPRLANMALVGGLSVLSLLAKPNYFLAFAPCFALAIAFVAYRGLRRKELSPAQIAAMFLVAFGPALCVLTYQYVSTFTSSDGRGARVVYSPFAIWSGLSKNITASILLSIAFPLAASILYFRQVVRDFRMLFAWGVLSVAIACYALLAESGDRAGNANFGWGAILANNVLFVVACDFLLRRPPSALRNAAFAVLGLHVISGTVCLMRCLYVPSLAGLF